MKHLEYIKDQFELAGKNPQLIDITNENAVRNFAHAMSRKLQAARKKGRHNWHDPEVISNEQLEQLLDEQMNKSERDYVDIGNLAMMLFYRSGQCDR